MADILIIGAGITGLSTARSLRRPYRIMEKERAPGGLCRSVNSNGCTFDYSGHLLHMRRPEIIKQVRAFLGKNLLQIDRNAWVYTQGASIPYPFQANLYALPQKVRDACLAGFIKRTHTKARVSYPDFLTWSQAIFGSGITRYFMKPYNEKLWTIPAGRLGADWVAPFVPRPSVEEVRRGARCRPKKKFGYNARFYYPARGGCQALVDAFARGTNIDFGVSACRISGAKKYVDLSDGRRLHYDRLVSTQPLPALIKSIQGVPANVKAAAAKLDWNTVYCLNLAMRPAGTDQTGGKQWVYFPEKKYPFYRAGIYTNIAPLLAPEGMRTMYVEISARPGTNPLSRETVASVFRGLADAELVSPADRVEIVHQLVMPYAYVIYDRYRSDALRVIHEYLASLGIHSIGRYGAWEYSFMEKSIVDGRQTADLINNARN